jgi:hypothetical protein
METLVNQRIENRIFTVREMQVMLDSDLAELYQVETRALNQSVKRNLARFPENFRFQITNEELNALKLEPDLSGGYSDSRSQIVILKTNSHKQGHNVKYLPYVFTEQGVAMLSRVIRSKIAIEVSIQIIQVFVGLKRLMNKNNYISQWLNHLEIKQWNTDENVKRIFRALESCQPKPEHGIFFEGQIFDAYRFISDLIRSSAKSIVLIDNYVDESVLVLLSKRNPEAKATIYAKNISKQLQLDLEKHNSQYPPIVIKQFKASHDRFLIIDRKELYHIGASLKDLGKKWFGFSRMSSELLSEVLAKLQGLRDQGVVYRLLVFGYWFLVLRGQVLPRFIVSFYH